MSDSEFSNPQNNEMKYSPKDALTDSLLKHVAANRRGENSDEFLSQIEEAINAGEAQTVPIPIRKAKAAPRSWKTIVRATAIAAVIALGALFWLVSYHLESTKPVPVSIVASSVASHESELQAPDLQTMKKPSVSPEAVITANSFSDFSLADSTLGDSANPKINIDGNTTTFDTVIRRELPLETGKSNSASDSDADYAIVGHGGYSTKGTAVMGAGGDIQVDATGSAGKITVTAGGEVDFLDSSLATVEAKPVGVKRRHLDSRYVQVGHGGVEASPLTSGHRSGAVRVDGELNESITLSGGYHVPAGPQQEGESEMLVTGLSRSRDTFSRNVESNSTRYSELIDNEWKSPRDEPLSTFSSDVDTASWTNLRGMIRSGLTIGQIPRDAVRIEEMINYFDWGYSKPDGEHPFRFATETASCPWNADHQLLRVGVQGAELPKSERPDANLVFLLDVSGSMNQPSKLALVKKSIMVLAEELREGDCVSMVVYAGAEGLAMPATSGRDTMAIAKALSRLNAGGSTNGGAGIKLAYRMAQENFIKDGINRVILCTDGDFNVGITGNESLVNLVERRARDGVFLSVLGYGNDNLNDSMLEEITNKGNGNYFFVDSLQEARKVFLRDLMGTLVAIAKDVKIQIEFNPAKVDSYRLIGYANRRLAAEDFENDKVDAGEVGSGHSVTALYEIVPAGNGRKDGKGLRYQKSPEPPLELIESGELALLKLRYKKPDSDVSTPMTEPVVPVHQNWDKASEDFQFASAVSLFGLILRDHESARDASLDQVVKLAESGKGNDPHGYRAEFIDLVKVLKAAGE